MESKFREYNVPPSNACREFQCAFDAGNYMMSEFVAYGTVTRVDDWLAFTLEIVHMQSSQTVFSEAGEVRRGTDANPGAALESVFRRMLEGLDPAKLASVRKEKHGLITVLNLSPGMAASRVLSARLSNHLQSTRNFDIMTQLEQRELLSALEINLAKFTPSDSGIFWLGAKMGVSHLLYTRLAGKDPDYSLGLALYDIQTRRKLREWPSRSMGDFRKLLLTEDKFFAGLFIPQVAAEKPRPLGQPRWHWAAAGAGLALTAYSAYATLASQREADRQYTLYRQALSSHSAAIHQDRVQRREREALIFGSAAGLGLLVAAASITFSF